MASDMYPNLGFNPCPGSPGHAESLAAALKKAKEALDEANQLVSKMRADNSTWDGPAAEAFAQHLKSRIGDDLAKGYWSISTAAEIMTDWSGKLQKYWDRAHAMEKEAAEAQAVLDGKQTDLNTASDGYTRTYDTREQADAAEGRYRRALDAWNDAKDKLDAIRDRAEEMRDDEYERDSKRAAERLEDAADFAAKEPGLLEKAGNLVRGIGKALVPQGDDNLLEKGLKVVAGAAAVVVAPTIALPAIGLELFGPDEPKEAIKVVHKKVEPTQLTSTPGHSPAVVDA